MFEPDKGYYYLHENGSLIFKSGIAYDESDLNGNPNVKRYWKVNIPVSRPVLWTVYLESLKYGMDLKQAHKFAETHGLDVLDFYTYTGYESPTNDTLDGCVIFMELIADIGIDKFSEWLEENAGKDTPSFPPEKRNSDMTSLNRAELRAQGMID